MKVKYALFAIFIFANSLVNAETIYRPTFPGSNIPDISKPAIVKDGNVIYESYPATTMRDYSKPSYVEERNGDGSSTIYEAFPGSNVPNKMKGGYNVKDRD